MKIFIVGMGAVASVMSYKLAIEPKVKEIILVSNNLKKDKEFIRPHKKISLMQADANKPAQIARLAKGSDLIVNAANNFLNIPVMKAALKAHANYQDFALTNNPPEQLKLHKQFKKEKLVGLFCTGIAPGITNLLVAESAARFDSVESVKIYSFEDQQAKKFISSWSSVSALDTLTDIPPVYRNGRFHLAKNFGDPEFYAFPAPFGKRPAYTVYGDEVVTLPRFLRIKSCSFKAAGSDIEIARDLYKKGLLSRAANSHGVNQIPEPPTPKEMQELIAKGTIRNAVYMCVIEVTGRKSERRAKQKLVARFPNLKKITKLFPGATYVSYPTGIAAASFANIIPRIDRCGVFPPEALASNLRQMLLKELQDGCFTLKSNSSF